MRRYGFYILMFLVVELFITISVFNVREQRFREYTYEQTALDQNYFNSAIKTFRKITSDVFNKRLNTPLVKEYMTAGYKDPSERNSLRNSLYQLVLPEFDTLKAVNLAEIQFHFPDSTSFLRMSRPAEYGDSLRSVRGMVTEANERNRYVEGFEMGRYMLGYRYIFPINTEKEHVGAVELIVSTEGLVNSMNLLYGYNFKYIMPVNFNTGSGSTTAEKLSDKYMIDSCDECRLEEPNINLSFYVNQIMKRDMDFQIEDLLKKDKASSYLAKYNGKAYILTFIPVRDENGASAGAIVSYHPAEVYDKIATYFYVLYALFSLIALSVTAAIAALDSSRRRIHNANLMLEHKVEEKVRELRSKEQFFSQQAKMVTMGEMLSAILHQWKQPISSVSLLADMLNFECDSGECSLEIRKYIKDIKEQTAFMAQTDRDFRNFLKPSTKPEIFNVCEAVQEIIRLFDFSFAKYNTSFRTSWTDEVGEKAFIKGYPNEFKHVLLNLFNNARDAIALRREKMIENDQNVAYFKGIIKIEVRIDDDMLCVTVTDTGGGIPDDVIGRIFQQYFSTKSENGSGIGLFMTKNLVESNMNGKISVRNVDEGAEFTIACPLVSKED
ncbi:MAG: ATP-binding protein [Deferribacterales bacterium]